MKASKTLLLAVLAATALAGCTNNEGEAPVPDLAGTPSASTPTYWNAA